MSSSAQRAALEAIHSARPLVARLGESKNSEDVAADIIEAWTAVEAGLRSLIGGSTLTGPMLIRELRQRHFLSLEQANSLAEFHAARERAGRTDYTPTDSDVNAARDAFLKLEAGLMGVTPPDSRPAPSAAPVGGGGARSTIPIDSVPPRGAAEPVGAPARTPTAARPRWVLPALGVLGVLMAGGIGWFALAGRGAGASYDQGVIAYREGRREAAAGAFIKATKDDPNNPMPHVYLARMAREAGRLSTANEEAVKAVTLGQTNVAALRELASVSFAMQNYDSARAFYTRALQQDPTDTPSQGYLGCSLVRLGRVEEGLKWIQRAGPGPWTGCAPAPGQLAPGQVPPGVQGQQTLPAYPR
jgi:tetratricopeptide (TPR) repeat protein